MLRQIFIGLPVNDLARATDFFVGLGFTVEPMASDERSASLVVNDGTMLMLNADLYSREFTQREIVDPATAREVTLDLSADGRGTSSPSAPIASAVLTAPSRCRCRGHDLVNEARGVRAHGGVRDCEVGLGGSRS